MLPLRLFASVALIGLAVIAAPFAVGASLMAAFGPNYHADNSVALLFFAACLAVPVIVIWLPSRAALFLGGLALVPPSLIGLILIIFAPASGLFVLVPLAIWYLAAAKAWHNLPAPPRRAVAMDPEDY